MPRVPAVNQNLPVPDRPSNDEGASTSRANTSIPRTPTERANALISAVKHPDLTQYLPKDLSISHSDKLLFALQTFQRSDEFKTFSAEMKACLTALQTSRFGGPQNTDYSQDYPELIEDLELNHARSGANQYGTALFGLYSQGCLYFKQILAMLQHAQNHPKDFRLGALKACEPLVQDFESELLICGPGLLQKIADATTKIRNTLFPPNMAKLVEETRVEIGRQLLINELGEFFEQSEYFANNEVHIVGTWMDALKESNQLQYEKIDDHFASREDYYDIVPPHEKLQIESRFADQVSYPNAIEHIAWTVLDELKQCLSELPEEQRNQASEVESRVLNQLDQRFGNLTLGTLFRPTKQSRLELHHEPSLLIAELRNKLEQEGALPAGTATKPTVFQLNGVDELRLCQWHKAFWTEFKTGGLAERGLLQLDDLTDDDALKVVKAVAPQLDTQTNFIAAPYLNHPVHSQKMAPFFSGHRHPQSIVTAAYLCSIANEHEAPRFASAFAFLAGSGLISAGSVVDVLSAINFSDTQIDTALQGIKASNMPGLNWVALESECLTGRSNTLNPRAFKTITQDMLLSSQAFNEVIASYAAKGNIDNLKLIIETYTNTASERSNAAITCLHNRTALLQNPKVIEYLISLIPDLDSSIAGYQNLLEYSLFRTTDDFAAKVAQKWIASGRSDFQNAIGANVVSMAASILAFKTLSVLMNHNNFKAQHSDQFNLSALDYALNAMNERPGLNPDTAFNTCKLLLEKGASPNHSIANSHRTWYDALLNSLPEPKSTNLLKLFLQHGAEDAGDLPSTYAVNRACECLQPEKAEALLACPDRFKASDFSLHVAMRSNQVQVDNEPAAVRQEVLRKMIALITILKPTPADLDRVDIAGITPIDYAIRHNHPDAAVEMFKQAGDVNQLDQDGHARIHKAVINKQQELVHLLVQAGANVNLQSASQHAGKTALHYAIRNNDADMQNLLLHLGARPVTREKRARSTDNEQAPPNKR